MIDIETIKSAVRVAAALYPIKRVELFGSYASGTAAEDSDIDLLVAFSVSPVSLLTICGLQDTLSELLRVDVDVVKLPLHNDSDLIIDKRVCVYESEQARRDPVKEDG